MSPIFTEAKRMIFYLESWRTLSTARNPSLLLLQEVKRMNFYLEAWRTLSTARKHSLLLLLEEDDSIPGVLEDVIHRQKALPALPLDPGLLQGWLLLKYGFPS